ncbi:hypothetical protein BsIDN1_05750 [Bacillus safensis]|uniref:Uncharacterized protein n=1 Tax=Bacillus safensis TaxID=561879 RepID=A0A5S9M015_BACIA|nr:hypothetical protein BsIDN1_05750 [Bacillus safensis]
MIRKVFQTITPDTVGSEHMMAGLTIFEPGKQVQCTITRVQRNLIM